MLVLVLETSLLVDVISSVVGTDEELSVVVYTSEEDVSTEDDVPIEEDISTEEEVSALQV